MGASYATNACFNPAKSYQLKWYEDQVATVDPRAIDGWREYVLNSVADYQSGNPEALISLRLEQLDIDGEKSKDYYVGYNRAVGANSGTREAQNEVVIVEKETGKNPPFEYGKSWLVATLSSYEMWSGHGISLVVNGNIGESVQDAKILVGEEITISPNAEDMAVYDGVWGGWKGWQYGSAGMYACGAQIRYEGKQGTFGDDTAANGLKLTFCDLDIWNTQEEVTIYNGRWGSWKERKMCPDGKYIVGARVRFEDADGADDDTALNGLEIRCAEKNGSDTIDVLVHKGDWGSWKEWRIAPSNKLVKGASVRFEDPIALGASDDTAMNGIKFNVETPLSTEEATNVCEFGLKLWFDGETADVDNCCINFRSCDCPTDFFPSKPAVSTTFGRYREWFAKHVCKAR